MTALMNATYNGDTDEINKILLSNNSIDYVNKQNDTDYDKTALMYACGGYYNSEDKGSVNAVKILLDKGANPNMEEGYDTALMYAASRNSDDALDMVNLLIKSGAEVNTKDTFGETTLIQAIKSNNNNVEIAKVLIDNTKKEDLQEALQFANGEIRKDINGIPYDDDHNKYIIKVSELIREKIKLTD